MPRKDIYHDTVVKALTQEGWTITDDPLILSYGGTDLYVDLGAERLVALEKAGQKIAVEIKSFLSASGIYDLELAIGQYKLYQDILSEVEPDRLLYLAVPERVYKNIFSNLLGQLVLNRQQLRLIVFDESQTKVVRWIP